MTREFFFGDQDSEWLVRLEWSLSDDKAYTVGFLMFEVRGRDAKHPMARLYGDNFSPKATEPEVQGDVKWDGCTSFHFGDTAMHVCNGEELTLLFDTLAEVRRVALDEVMAWGKEQR